MLSCSDTPDFLSIMYIEKTSYTLTAKDPKQDFFGFLGGLESGGSRVWDLILVISIKRLGQDHP